MEHIEADGGLAAEEQDNDPDLAHELVDVDDCPDESGEWPAEHLHALSLLRVRRWLSRLVHGGAFQ